METFKRKLFATLVPLLFIALSPAQGRELKDAMEAMEQSFNSLSKGLRAGELKEHHIQDARDLHQFSLKSTELTPETAQDDEDKADYKNKMEKFTKKTLELEAEVTLVVEGEKPQDLETAIAIWKDLNRMRKRGHKDFKPDDDE